MQLPEHISDKQEGELLLFRDNASFGSRTFSTIGFDNSSGLCLFAVGLRNDALPAGRVADYSLLGDGVGRIGGQTLRLFGSTGTLRFDTAVRNAKIDFTLVGRSDPFGNFLPQASNELTVLTATVPLLANSFQGPLTGTNGFTGTIEGQLVGPVASNSIGGGGAGAVFTFQVSNGRGDVLFGAIAAERL